MLVREIMTPKIETIPPTTSLREAAQKMRDLKIGTLPVAVDEKLIGIVTDRDICCRAVAEGMDLDLTEVREIMTRDVGTCFGTDTVTAAARLMEQHHSRRLAVLNADKTVAGFLTVDDLAHYSPQLAGQLLDLVRWVPH